MIHIIYYDFIVWSVDSRLRSEQTSLDITRIAPPSITRSYLLVRCACVCVFFRRSFSKIRIAHSTHSECVDCFSKIFWNARISRNRNTILFEGTTPLPVIINMWLTPLLGQYLHSHQDCMCLEMRLQNIFSYHLLDLKEKTMITMRSTII